jgi:hypothetical protein
MDKIQRSLGIYRYLSLHTRGTTITVEFSDKIGISLEIYITSSMLQNHVRRSEM